LFRPELPAEAISDIRMAIDQGQPLGDARFIDGTERATGQRREIRPRGRPRKSVLEEMGPQNQMSLGKANEIWPSWRHLKPTG
jgi:putative transposase